MKAKFKIVYCIVSILTLMFSCSKKQDDKISFSTSGKSTSSISSVSNKTIEINFASTSSAKIYEALTTVKTPEKKGDTIEAPIKNLKLSILGHDFEVELTNANAPDMMRDMETNVETIHLRGKLVKGGTKDDYFSAMISPTSTFIVVSTNGGANVLNLTNVKSGLDGIKKSLEEEKAGGKMKDLGLKLNGDFVEINYTKFSEVKTEAYRINHPEKKANLEGDVLPSTQTNNLTSDQPKNYFFANKPTPSGREYHPGFGKRYSYDGIPTLCWATWVVTIHNYKKGVGEWDLNWDISNIYNSIGGITPNAKSARLFINLDNNFQGVEWNNRKSGVAYLESVFNYFYERNLLNLGWNSNDIGHLVIGNNFKADNVLGLAYLDQRTAWACQWYDKLHHTIPAHEFNHLLNCNHSNQHIYNGWWYGELMFANYPNTWGNCLPYHLSWGSAYGEQNDKLGRVKPYNGKYCRSSGLDNHQTVLCPVNEKVQLHFNGNSFDSENHKNNNAFWVDLTNATGVFVVFTTIADWDTYLYALNGSGDIITSNDDYGGKLQSRIVVPNNRDGYNIVVSGYRGQGIYESASLKYYTTNNPPR